MRSGRAVAGAAVLALAVSGCSAKPPSADLKCSSRPAQVLAAQSVPDAQYVPCISDVLPPWSLMSTNSDQDRTEVVLEWSSSSSTHEQALVTLKPSCPAGGSPFIDTTLPIGIDSTRSTSGRTVTTTYTFEGGCVQVDVTRARQHEVAPLTLNDFTVEFVPREVLDDYVLNETNNRVGLDPEEGS